MITVMVPAMNEEANLRAAVETIVESAHWAGDLVLDVIIVNDGSTDGTAAVIRELEKEYPFVRSIHHPRNRGIGVSFREVLALAKYDRLTIFAGDNNATPFLIRNLFRNHDKADLVIAFIINMEYRSRFRQMVSLLFSTIYTVVFNIQINYINGNPVYPVQHLRRLKLHSRTYGILAEANVKLLRQGITYHEVEGYNNPDVVKSKAISLRNMIEVSGSFLRLVFEIYFFKKEEYSRKSRRVGIPALEGGGTREPVRAARAP